MNSAIGSSIIRSSARIRVRWTRILDSGFFFVYSPFLGRLYRVSGDILSDRIFSRILGLRDENFRETLEDPATGILLSEPDFVGRPPASNLRTLRLLYRVFHWSRYLVSFCFMLRQIRFWGRAVSKEGSPLAVEIGQRVYEVERACGVADCYPRALMTAYLCVKYGLSCEVSVGALVPTRKMHAWCSVRGMIPYEDFPGHYMYQPLIVVSLDS